MLKFYTELGFLNDVESNISTLFFLVLYQNDSDNYINYYSFRLISFHHCKISIVE